MNQFTYENFIRQTDSEVDLERLNNLFIQAVSGFGFDRVALNLKSNHEEIGLKEEIAVMTNIPHEWMNIYHRENMQMIDPVQILARDKSEPFKWDDTRKEIKLSIKQEDFLKRLPKVDLHDGYFFPLWRHNAMAGIGIARSSPDGEIDADNVNLIAAFCRQYYECYVKLQRESFLKQQKRENEIENESSGFIILTARETEILKLAAKGLKDHEIAEQLDLSRHTVDSHFRNIYKKLSAKSRTEAVASAVSNHLIWL